MLFAEFFAGGGMVSEALSPRWTCVYANDFSPKKAWAYKANHKTHANALTVKPIQDVTGDEVPDVDLMWGSFPCQDLSVAGKGLGLSGARSGTFFEFCRVIDEMKAVGRVPTVIALENVVGLERSNGGRDIKLLMSELKRRGYVVGRTRLDAVHFLPQSRPRLFIVAVQEDVFAANNGLLELDVRGGDWHIPPTTKPPVDLSRVMQDKPAGVDWHTQPQTKTLLGMMSPINLAKVQAARARPGPQTGFIYKRTRIEDGVRIQRAEIRFDGVAGCLRTPGGGSSRQLVMVVDGQATKSRLLSPREGARLMGLPDSYILPDKYNDAYYLLGDGVAVPVVAHLAKHLIEPLISSALEAVA